MAIKTQQDPRLFKTSGGQDIKLRLVPPLQAEMARNAAMKEAVELFGAAVKPTYMTLADETFEHDATTIAESGTDEDKAAWKKFKETEDKHNNHVGSSMMRFFLFYGVDVDPDADTSWEKRQRAFKIEIPEDEIERKIHYIQSEYIYSREDLEGITQRLMTLGGVRPEVVDTAVSSFRD